jgi:hypothetical protein
MARSIQTIYDSILAAKETDSNLDELNSPSNTAIYKLIMYAVATAVYLHEVIFDNHKVEVEAISARGAYGTKPWWDAKIRAYQHGDLLVFNEETFTFEYEVIDPEKQIVKRVSIDDQSGILKIKAAKLTGLDVVPLSEAQLNGLIEYIKDIRPAGTRVLVQSLSPDKLKIFADVYYDPSGELDTIKAAVEAAIISFINAIPFDGIINRNKLIDAITAVPGVVDVDITYLGAKVGANPYTTIEREYRAVSGYFEVDEDFLLTDTLSYVV